MTIKTCESILNSYVTSKIKTNPGKIVPAGVFNLKTKEKIILFQALVYL